MILDGLISLLTAASGDPNLTEYGPQMSAVAAITGANVFQSVLKRGFALPALAIHRYGGMQDYDYSGPIDLREDQIQIDCYAEKAAICQSASEAVRALLVGYVGTLSDGTVVQAVYLERQMDMPFLPNADSTSLAFRSLLGFKIVSER